jgi:AcrR family transcriptional regulator
MDQPANGEDSEVKPTRAYGGVSAEQRRQHRRRSLIDAGIEVFGTRGLRQATMRDICGAARLSERYFYESFGSVQDVFEAVYTALRVQLIDRLSRAMTLHSSEGHLAVAEAGQYVMFSFIREDPRRVRIMLIDVQGLRFAHLGQPQEADAVYAIKPYSDLSRRFFKVSYPMADELDLDIDLVHQNLIGMTVQSAAVWADHGFDKSLDDIVRHTMYAWRGFDAWVQELVAEWARKKDGAAS